MFEPPIRYCTVCQLLYGINREATRIAQRGRGKHPMQWYECDSAATFTPNGVPHVHPYGPANVWQPLAEFWRQMQASLEKQSAERVMRALEQRAGPEWLEQAQRAADGNLEEFRRALARKF